MNVDNIAECIARGESADLEFKKSTGQRTDAARTICAMLNGVGGFVVFGMVDVVGRGRGARWLLLGNASLPNNEGRS